MKMGQPGKPSASLRKYWAALVLPAAILAVAIPALSAGAQSGGSGASGPPPIYSTAQAKLGAAAYNEHCAKCHVLNGEGMGPALSGEVFFPKWEGKPVRALYGRIISTMPSDDPGSLTEKEAIDIVAYVLQLNDLKGGASDVQSPNELNKIIIQRPPK